MKYIINLFAQYQVTMPAFPVVVKIGHAHSGVGKVTFKPKP